MDFRASIVTRDGKFLCECKLADISDGGARLTVDSTEQLADEFIVMLSENGVRRPSRVVWRSNSQLEISFNVRDVEFV